MGIALIAVTQLVGYNQGNDDKRVDLLRRAVEHIAPDHVELEEVEEV